MAIQSIFQLGFPWQTQDPFLFCVYHLDHYPKGKEDLSPDASLEGRSLGNDFTLKDGWRMYHGHTVPGFPSHPHRGFETITIVNKGYCDHSDSLGAAGRFGNGDVQWMTAGRGVQHSEMFPLLQSERENPLELFQIWLNLPKAGKFADPHFKMLWHEDIPVVDFEGGTLKIIAGSFGSSSAPEPAPDSWAANPENQVAVWQISFDPGATFTIPAAVAGLNRSLYFYDGGQIHVEGETVAKGHGLVVRSEANLQIENGEQKASLLMLQGKPIAEPVVQYGPFVMNTEEEIQKAMQEYRLTQFGGWPWPYPDNVHPRERARFAKYPDGKLEEKPLA